MSFISKTITTVAALLVGANALASKSDSPSVKTEAGKVTELVLGSKATAALKRYNPNFQIYEQKDFVPSLVKFYQNPMSISMSSKSCAYRPYMSAPMGVVGDFNGDRINDAVVIGHDDKNELVLGIISAGSGYNVTVIEKDKFVPPSESYFPPKTEGTKVPDPLDRDVRREQGILKSLSLVESKSVAKKDKCLPQEIQRFNTDAVLVSTYMSSNNRLYNYELGGFVRFAPPETNYK